MDVQKKREIEWDCQQVIIKMGYAQDIGDFQGFVSHFTEDGVWSRMGEDLQGHEAILEVLAKRSPTLRIRHVFTNFIFTIHDETSVHCQSYMHGRRADPGEGVEGPVPVQDQALWIYQDDMVLKEGSWKVAKRWADRIFEDEY